MYCYHFDTFFDTVKNRRVFGGLGMEMFLFMLFAATYLLIINSMTNTMVVQKEIAEEKVPSIFTTINILIIILLTSTYVRLVVV